MYFERITKRDGGVALSDRKHVEASRSYVITVFVSSPPGKSERLVSVLIMLCNRKLKLTHEINPDGPSSRVGNHIVLSVLRVGMGMKSQ